MKLIVGLGNPGGKYARNRHNIGYMAVDRIAEDHGFGAWKSKFQGRICEGRLGGEKVMLLKPETFMNLSGQSVGEAMRFYKLKPAEVTVLHDELDLAPGKARVKQGGGHAGHNGLRSLHGHIGDGYARVRLGIGHPGRKELVSGYVLHDFARADEDWLGDLLWGVSDGAPHLAAGDGGKFMNAVALRTVPQRDAAPARARKPAKPQTEKPQPAKSQSAKPQPAKPQPERTQPEKPESEPAPVTDTRSTLQRLLDRFN